MAKSWHEGREIEVKLRVKDVLAMARRVVALGATSEGRVREQNTLYDSPDSFFQRRGRLLRVRIETPAGSGGIRTGKQAAVVTFKAPAPGKPNTRYKEKLEWEAPIEHPEEWVRQLRSLGFKPGFEYEKYRSSFRLSGVQVCLDETPIGDFLELEGGPAAIDRAARRLGYCPSDYIRATYWDLYAANCARRGQRPRHLLFRA